MEDPPHSRFVAEYLIRNIAYCVLDYYTNLKKHTATLYIACVTAWQTFPCGFGAKKKRAKNRQSKRGEGEGKEGNLPSPSPCFFFWLSFHFSHGQKWKSRFEVFLLCSETARRRLLRRLSRCGAYLKATHFRRRRLLLLLLFLPFVRKTIRTIVTT